MVGKIKDIDINEGFNYIDWKKEGNEFSIYDDCSFYYGTKEDLLNLYNKMLNHIANKIVELTKEI